MNLRPIDGLLCVVLRSASVLVVSCLASLLALLLKSRTACLAVGAILGAGAATLPQNGADTPGKLQTRSRTAKAACRERGSGWKNVR